MNKQILTLTAALAAAALAAAPVSCLDSSIKAQAAENQRAQVYAAGQSVKTYRKYRVKADIINVRCGPDTSYPVIGTLTRGQKIKALSVHDGWAQVRFAGVTAWVSTRYLSPAKTHRPSVRN